MEKAVCKFVGNFTFHSFDDLKNWTENTTCITICKVNFVITAKQTIYSWDSAMKLSPVFQIWDWGVFCKMKKSDTQWTEEV